MREKRREKGRRERGRRGEERRGDLTLRMFPSVLDPKSSTPNVPMHAYTMKQIDIAPRDTRRILQRERETERERWEMRGGLEKGERREKRDKPASRLPLELVVDGKDVDLARVREEHDWHALHQLDRIVSEERRLPPRPTPSLV